MSNPTVIFLNAPQSSTTIYSDSKCNGAAFIYSIDEAREEGWADAVQTSIDLYKASDPDDPIFLSFNASDSDETPEEMVAFSDFNITGVFVDASSVSGKTKAELKTWLLQYNDAVKNNGAYFGFYLGDAYIETSVGWTAEDLADFADAGVRIWVDVYAHQLDDLRGSLITWDYPYLHVHFHMGNPGEGAGYYKTYEEINNQFNLVKQHPTVEAIQVYPCRITDWHITYPRWVALAIRRNFNTINCKFIGWLD